MPSTFGRKNDRTGSISREGTPQTFCILGNGAISAFHARHKNPPFHGWGLALFRLIRSLGKCAFASKSKFASH